MNNLQCTHCGGDVEVGINKCPHCGIPLPPGFGQEPQKKFKLFFIALVIFCVGMMLWLPPNWMN